MSTAETLAWVLAFGIDVAVITWIVVWAAPRTSPQRGLALSHPPSELLRCPRCGIERLINRGRSTDALCRDCRTVDPGWPDVVGSRRKPPPPEARH